MTDREIQRLAHAIILEATTNDDLLAKIAKMMKKETKGEKRLVSTKKAAEMLGISTWQLYRIKDDENGKPRFSYEKGGDKKSSTLKFNASTIVDEYERYCIGRYSGGVK